jgi:hypothetical protein
MNHLFVDLAVTSYTLQVGSALNQFFSPSQFNRLGAIFMFLEYLENWESFFQLSKQHSHDHRNSVKTFGFLIESCFEPLSFLVDLQRLLENTFIVAISAVGYLLHIYV